MAVEAFARHDLDIHFVIERSQHYTGAEKVFYQIKDSRDPVDHHISKLLRTCTPGDKIDFPGLQVADVLAYTAFQSIVRIPIEPTPLPRERAYQAAKKQQKTPLINLPMPPDSLRQYKQLVLDEIKRREERKLARTARRNDAA
jgi:hypothetical protein